MTIGKILLTTVAALCLLGAAPLYAQVDPGVRFTTTFPFYVGNKQLPAGTYLVTTPESSPNVLLIADKDAPHAAFISFISTESIRPIVQGKAVFHEYGDVAFLNQLTVTGELFGAEFLPDKKETQVAKTEHEQASIRVVESQIASGM